MHWAPCLPELGPLFKIALHIWVYDMSKTKLVTTSFKLPFHCNDILVVVK